MKTIDRKKEPSSLSIDHIEYLKASSQTFGDGSRLHIINSGEEEIVKIELQFEAGTIYQDKPLVAALTNSLIVEGTTKYSSREIAEKFDNSGAFLETNCTHEHAFVTLYCLSAHLKALLPFFKEIIFSASFPSEELENHLSIKRQKFAVNKERVAFIAKNNFLSFLLGSENVYANKIQESDFESVSRKQLLDFYEDHYLDSSLNIYMSGKVTDKAVELVKELFGRISRKKNRKEKKLNFSVYENQESELLIPKEKAIQTAMRIGVPTIGRKHPEFPIVFLTNTILGGYFGSRLMSNIREEKGFTYGIGSGIVSLKNCSYFVISTEVGDTVARATLKEIEIELERLSNSLVEQEELTVVKNYIIGSIMCGFDGAFAAMDRFKMLNNMELDYSYYDNLVTRLKQIDAGEIKKVSQQYFQYSEMKKILAGKF